MAQWLLKLFVMHLMLYHCECYNLLVVSPLNGKSHAILGDGIVKHLLKDGHQITYITAYPETMSHKNLTAVDVSDRELDSVKEKRMNLKALMEKQYGFLDMTELLKLFLMFNQRVLNNPDVQALLMDTTVHFDAIIAEWMFSEMFSSLQAVFKCPFIWFSSVEPHWMVLKLVDELPNPAYTAEMVSPDVPPFTFWRRAEELYSQLYGHYLQYKFSHYQEQQYYEQHIVPKIRDRSQPIPTMDTLRLNASLVLSNSHVSMGEATRLPQNFIPIGGYHIDTKIDSLPENLQKLMDDSKSGVIYFSMGTNLKSEDLPQELKKGLLRVLGTFKQTVIWKFGEDLPNRPSNVHIMKWAPQQSILAHPNCVLFITHGGLLSTTEAIHFGVPIVGIPVFADQFVNIERAVKKGFATKVTLSYTMEDEFQNQVASVLNDPKYRARAKELSLVYHERPIPPGAELVHWVKHVVRTRGAPHLRSPALHLPYYQKWYLDLGLLLLTILVVVLYGLRKLYSVVYTKSIGNKKTN